MEKVILPGAHGCFGKRDVAEAAKHEVDDGTKTFLRGPHGNPVHATLGNGGVEHSFIAEFLN